MQWRSFTWKADNWLFADAHPYIFHRYFFLFPKIQCTLFQPQTNLSNQSYIFQQYLHMLGRRLSWFRHQELMTWKDSLNYWGLDWFLPQMILLLRPHCKFHRAKRISCTFRLDTIWSTFIVFSLLICLYRFALVRLRSTWLLLRWRNFFGRPESKSILLIHSRVTRTFLRLVETTIRKIDFRWVYFVTFACLLSFQCKIFLNT